MADETKEVLILELKIDRGQGEKEIDSLTKSIESLKVQNEALVKSNKDLKKAGQDSSKEFLENAKQIELNKDSINKNTSARKNTIQAIRAEDSSLGALKARLSEQKRLRDQVNLSTKAGQVEFQRLTASIKEQTEQLLSAEKAGGTYSRQVGNYPEALDKFTGGLATSTKGIYSMLKASLAFLATPIGLVIGALGVAIFALTSYFKGSEEGQNKWNKVVAVGSALFEQLMNVVEKAGEVIFNAIENPKQSLKDFGELVKENLINRFNGILELLPALGKSIKLLFQGEFEEAGRVAYDAAAKAGLGIENMTAKLQAFAEETKAMVDRGISYGERLAAMQAKIDKADRALVEQRAATNLKVAKLKDEAVELEGEAKRKVISEAIELERKLSDAEVTFASLKLKNAQLTVEANGDEKAALKELSDARAAMVDAETLAFETTLKLRKQLQSVDDEIFAAQEAAWEREKERIGEQMDLARKKSDLEIEINDRFLARLKSDTKERKKIAKTQKDIDQENFEASQEIAGQSANLFKKGTAAYQISASSEALMSTYAAANKALEDFPFPLNGIIAGLLTAKGLFNVGKINAIKFARGGEVRTGADYFKVGGKLHSEGGTKYYGQDGNVFEVERGESIFVMNRRADTSKISRASAENVRTGGVPFSHKTSWAASGGQIETSRAINAIDSQMNVERAVMAAMQNLPPIFVTVEDINARQSRVNSLENKARVL